MSHSAASTGSDSRPGVPETRRWTCEADRSTPRSRSSGTSSLAVKTPLLGHHLAQPPPVADLAFHACLRARDCSAAATVGVQVPAARPGAEVRRHAGVDGSGAGRLVADLFLDKTRIPAVLDQVGDIRPAQRVEVQAVVQAQGLAVGDEAGVEPLAADPRSALGGPGRRVAVGAEQRADLGEPLTQMSGVQSHTVSTLRRLGGEPFMALPNRTRHRPNSPNSGARAGCGRSRRRPASASRCAAALSRGSRARCMMSPGQGVLAGGTAVLRGCRARGW